MPPSRHPEFIGKLSYQFIGLASFPKVLRNYPAFSLIALIHSRRKQTRGFIPLIHQANAHEE
jgi:hypothetical protein